MNNNLDELIKEIAGYIIKTVQEESSGFQCVVDYGEVGERFMNRIEEAVNNAIVDELNTREEVADVVLDTDGYDVVLYTDYAPNYCKEDYEDEE